MYTLEQFQLIVWKLIKMFKIRNLLFSLIVVLFSSSLSAQMNSLIVDQYWSPYSGAAANTFVFNSYKYLDDRFLPSSEHKTSFLWGVGRFGKWYVDSLLSSFLYVAQHEFFGHGYRAREFDFSYVGYEIGIAHGFTRFYASEYNNLLYTQQAAFNAAGMEATTIMSQRVRDNFFLDGKIDRRDANLFFFSAYDQINYIYGSSDEKTTVGNDINGYVNTVNNWYGNKVLTVKKLRNKDVWDLLDPTLYMALYTQVCYVIDGDFNQPMYMFDIKKYKYLPTPRLLLSPWGPEFQLQNNVVTPKNQLLQVNLRYGKTSFIKSYGIDVLMRPIYKYKDFSFGNKLYLWRQPKFLTQNYAAAVDNGFGVGEFVNVEYNIKGKYMAYAELGYKTSGYIQGYPLGNSTVWRFGAGIRF
jgi:hypothetical protein